MRTGSGMCTCKGCRLQAASVEVSARESERSAKITAVSDSYSTLRLLPPIPDRKGMGMCRGCMLQAASVEVSPREFGKIGGVINVSDSV